jgi:hypothetical protein
LRRWERAGILILVNGDAERLERVVLGFSEVGLRVEWLRDYLANTPPANAATTLEELCEASERSDPSAREAVLSLALLLARSSEEAFVGRLREEAEQHHLLCLGRLLRRSPSRPPAADRAPDPPIPDYRAGRELTVGERRSLARSPTRRDFDKLLSDPHPLVIRQLLENPRLTENDVLRIAARRPARVDALQAIARSERWLARPRIRMAILLNPGSPPGLALPLLAACTRTELVEVVQSADTNKLLRSTARELLVRRPPLDVPDDADRILQ